MNPLRHAKLVGELLSSISAGVSLSADNRSPSEGEVGILALSALSGQTLDPDACKAIAANRAHELGPSLRSGSILMSRSNTPELVGACAYVERDRPDRFLPDLIWDIRVRPDAACEARWLTEYFRSAEGRRNLRRAAAGTSGSMVKLSMDRLRRLRLRLPPLHVQRATVATSAACQAIISNLTSLILAKRQFKRGIAQQLLTGQKRFPTFVYSNRRQKGEFGTIPKDWDLVRIGDIAQEVAGRGALEDSVVYSCTKHNGLVPSLEYFGKQVFSRNLGSYKQLRTGDFAYATNHIEEGSIGLLRPGQKPGLVSPMYTVFRCDKQVNPEFLFALLKTENYRRVFEKRTSASVDRRGSLRWAQFSQIRVPLPSRKEQDRIAKTLNMLDSELSLLAAQLENYSNYKRGLLARLLSGELPVAP